MDEAHHPADPKRLDREERVVDIGGVGLGVLDGLALLDVAVQQGGEDNVDAREDGVVERGQQVLEDDNLGPGRDGGKVEERHVVEQLDVELVQDQASLAEIVPVSVDEQEGLQEAELANGVIGGTGSLATFLAQDSDTDGGGLDHCHVIGAVADGERDRLGVFLDEQNDLGLLQWRHTAADHRLAQQRQLQEVAADVGLEGVDESRAVDHQSEFLVFYFKI